MKNIFPGLVVGLVLGAGGTWLFLSPHTEEAAAEKPAGLDITADSASIARQLAAAGLTHAVPTSVALKPEIRGYGRVLDPNSLVALVSEIDAAKVAADASATEFNRVKALHDDGENASLQAVETAQAAAQRDRSALAAARSRLVSGWGRTLAARTDLGALAESLAAGDSAIVRIDLLSGDEPAGQPVGARVGPLAHEGALRDVELLGPAPAADPQTQGAGWLALWREHPLPPGTALRAAVAAAGEGKPGLEVPRSAFVRHEGGVFVYVQTSTGGFERRIVTLGEAVPGGIAVSEGVSEKDQVVVTGAQQLLASEILGATGGGGED